MTFCANSTFVTQYLFSHLGDEIGMLEDMAVGISDLKKVAFKIIEAKTNDVLPVITGRRYVVPISLRLSFVRYALCTPKKGVKENLGKIWEFVSVPFSSLIINKCK